MAKTKSHSPIKAIHKSSSNPTTPSPLLSEKGQPMDMSGIYRFVKELSRSELEMPQLLCTIDQMCMDAAVANSIRFRTDMLTLAIIDGVVKAKDSENSKKAADFLNYCIRNMSSGGWMQSVRDASSYLKYGFSILNIVLEKKKFGKYKDWYTLKKLAPRSQKSIYGWVWDDNGRELSGVLQKPLTKAIRLSNGEFNTRIPYSDYVKISDGKYSYIGTKEMLLFSYNTTNNNPQGNPLAAECFEAFLEKKIVEQYELTGVSKDLGGVIVARSPSELFEQANDPENFPDAALIKHEFERDLAKVHQSDTTFLHLQSDRDDKGHYIYDFDLKGVDGGGKMYKTSEIISAKEKAIYHVFNTQALILGSEGGGSYALSKDQMTSFQYAVQRDMAEFAEVLNTQLLPRLLAVNGIYLDYDEMPYFEPLNPFKVTYDEAGKFIQRVASVSKLTPSVMEYILTDLGVPTDGIEDLDYTDKGESRAGESKGTSGTGNSQSAKGGDGNLENKSLFKACNTTDRIFDKEGNCLNSDDLDENGFYKKDK